MYWWLHVLGLCWLSLSSKQQNNHINNDNQIIKPALVAACIGTGEDPEIADKELDSWPACYNVIVNNEYCLIKMIFRDGAWYNQNRNHSGNVFIFQGHNLDVNPILKILHILLQQG